VETNYNELVNDNFIEEIFGHEMITSQSGKYCVTMQGKVLSMGGKSFFDSREQAMRAFYNRYRWVVCRNLHLKMHPGSQPYRWWSDEDRTHYWKSFKKVAESKYGFKIMQV
jgi:hypothetical protein